MKIAVFAINPAFFSALRQELRTHHQIREFERTESDIFNLTQINRLIDWCDLAFFDFAQYPLNVVTNLACMEKPIIVRGHGLELFTPHKIDWSKVGTLILSPVCREIFLDQNPKNVPKILELPIGCDVDFFTLSPLKEKGCFGKKIVTHSNVMRPKKRIYTTIQLFRELLDSDPEWELFVVGNFKYGFKDPSLSSQEEYNWPIKELIQDLGLTEKIWFTNNMAKNVWRDFLIDKDIFWSNSYLEGFHVSCAEAMSTGCFPVVNCWHGADSFYPPFVIHRTIGSMMKSILSWGKLTPDEKIDTAFEARKWIKKFDEKKIALRIREEIEDFYDRKRRVY